MYPILFSVGGLSIYSFSIFLVMSWCVWSFLFWKKLRTFAVADERIFDIMFYATLVTIFFSRLTFVLTHQVSFADNWLKVGALWIAPGLSFYGALISGVFALFLLSKRYTLRFGYVLDSFVMSFPIAMIVGLFGSFLDGTTIGLSSNLPWAVTYVGHLTKRHPVQLYEILVYASLACMVFLLEKKSDKDHWPYGIVATWYFFASALLMFGVEFFKESDFFIAELRFNQWILIAIFAESLGILYMVGGGKQAIGRILVKIFYKTRLFAGGIYAKISKKRVE
ncbi:prolipoprotein diacylglyceryl transferase [Candidatus Gottesmanbacteria bacterium]|nr:prolipoprotein diacylglyceryl transferase [Candidatus Gottesmanbacteria bacterium]